MPTHKPFDLDLENLFQMNFILLLAILARVANTQRSFQDQDFRNAQRPFDLESEADFRDQERPQTTTPVPILQQINE